MKKKTSSRTDKLTFAKETEENNDRQKKQFKLLIVDDEKEVHVMTKLVLSDYNYKDYTLRFLSAFSGKEARQLIMDNPDAALILLDVVMENKTAGLDVARFIRKEQKNHKIRIILRTGQPGKAPEKDIILNYDINDYKEKTELTTQKLFTSVTTALRSYIHLEELEEKNKLIAQKNQRLNEEIARRLVAESNLTKYNRSLEKMIDSKSSRLKKAIHDLVIKEKQLVETNRMAQVGDISSSTIDALSRSGSDIDNNLETINRYRLNMTQLLEKYEVLQKIITSHTKVPDKINQKTHEVIGDIDQFKKDIELRQILKKYPGIIKDSTKGIKHISTTVNDIKLFVSICDEPLKKISIQKLLETALDKAAARFSSKINIQVDFDAVPSIPIAPEGVKKAFSAILDNAFEAVASRGVVSVETLCEKNSILIHISDNGDGIALENQEFVFKPYFTTRKRKHRGLGLSFAKSVILSHKGTIDLSSSPNQGTTVTIKLPV